MWSCTKCALSPLLLPILINSRGHRARAIHFFLYFFFFYFMTLIRSQYILYCMTSATILNCIFYYSRRIWCGLQKCFLFTKPFSIIFYFSFRLWIYGSLSLTQRILSGEMAKWINQSTALDGLLFDQNPALYIMALFPKKRQWFHHNIFKSKHAKPEH